jgi:peptidoglycan hydrolase CwlO-like protein
VRRRYDEVIRVKKSIEEIKGKNNKDNENLKMIVNRLADKQKDLLKRINNTNQLSSSIVINESSILRDLAASEEECNQYMGTR